SPPARPGGAYMKLSLAAYSFNRLLPNRKPMAEQEKAEFTIPKFVDFCAKMNLDGCEPTSYYFPAEVTRDYLLALKHQAFTLGLDISGTAIGSDFGKAEGPDREE